MMNKLSEQALSESVLCVVLKQSPVGKGKGGTVSHRTQGSACIQERDFPTFKNW